MAPKNKVTDKQGLNQVDAEWNEENAQILQGMFGFSIGEQAIPALTIVQDKSNIPGYRGHVGEIYNTVTHEFYQKIEVLIVGMNTPRAVFPFPYSNGSSQLCSSVDGIVPYAKYVGSKITASSAFDEQTIVIPEACEDCPLFDSPLCTRMFRYFGLTVHDMQVMTFRLKKSAMPAAKELNYWLNQLAQRAQFRTFYFSARETNSGGNSFFVPVFEVGRDATNMLKEAYNMNRLLEDRIRQVSQQQLTGGEE